MPDRKAENLNEFLYRQNLLKPGEKAVWTPLAGGVSSDIWRVDLPGRSICVKRALANLKVAADWQAPVERNNYEWEWFKFVYRNFPEIVPQPLAHDSEMQMLAMEFLEPENFKVWKKELLEGIADADFAAKVGSCLGKIHAAGAFNKEVAETFATDDLFYALRIEPYLLVTAEKHPDLASRIKQIADQTLKNKISLVHGDVSPKNILKGKAQPIFLDAETAWYGDPAFDLAFCLNHFLLKSAYRPDLSAAYLGCYQSLSAAYLREVSWETPNELNLRAARLLPVLFLARVDGKSPVEYITGEKTKSLIRRAAGQMINDPPDSLEKVSRIWLPALGQ